MIRIIPVLILLSLFVFAKAEDDKTVTLTQISQGKTKDAAKYNALRNAIEKAFGTFIFSNTTGIKILEYANSYKEVT